MSQDNAARFRRLIDVGFTTGDITIVDELVAPDCVEHQRGNQAGSEGVKQVIRTLHHWMSDFSLTVEDIVADGDMVWARNRARGVDVIDIARFEDGRIVEHWGIADQLGMMLQLGLMPGRQPAAHPGPPVATPDV